MPRAMVHFRLFVFCSIVVLTSCSSPLAGDLTGGSGNGWSDQKFFTFLDTDQDGIVTTREYRRGLVKIIIGANTNKPEYDLDGDSNLGQTDVRRGISFIRTALQSVCGNSTIDTWETCDDGNATGNDGCTATCRKELGFTCNEQGCTKTLPTCGDGIAQAWEECDTGDKATVGCSTECTIERGFSCTGYPSICTPEDLNLAGWYSDSHLLTNLPPFTYGTPTHHVVEPAMTGLPNNRAIAVWAEGEKLYNDTTGGPKRAIVSAVYDGNTWSDPHVIDSAKEFNAGRNCAACTQPTVFEKPQGSADIFWAGPIGIETGPYALYLTEFNGNEYNDARLLTPNPFQNISEVVARFNEAGQGVAAWSEMENAGAGTVKTMRYTPEHGWSDVTDAATFSFCLESSMGGIIKFINRPGVGIDSTGNITIAYRNDVVVPEYPPQNRVICRTDVLAVTSESDTTWSSPHPIVQNTTTWSGYSPSYTSGNTYTHSVNEFAFEVTADGTAVLAYHEAIPDPLPAQHSFPRLRLFAKTRSNGQWSPAANIHPEEDLRAGDQILLAVNPKENDALILSRIGSDLRGTWYIANALKNGTWKRVNPYIEGANVPLALHWSDDRDRFVVAYSKDSMLNTGSKRGLMLYEYNPITETFGNAFNFFEDFSSEPTDAVIAETTDKIFVLWTQPKQMTSVFQGATFGTNQQQLHVAVTGQ